MDNCYSEVTKNIRLQMGWIRVSYYLYLYPWY